MKSIREAGSAVRDYFAATMRHPLGFLGINLTTFAGLLLVVLLVLETLGMHGNPYLGIVTFMILPGVFLLGLILMPIGRHLHRRNLARQGVVSSPFPVIDFNQTRTRNRTLLFGGITLLNLSILAVVSYRALEFLDSVEFCGEVCHEVMHPELTAYQNSPHARVRCVDCHIGPGASWFVRSKLSGTRQVFAAALKTYPRPIPTPVHNLRPARETCEQCHWPTKFHGSQLWVRDHYQEDEANTLLRTVLNLRVGGGDRPTEGPSIHWHVMNRVEYASDESRENIHWVRVHLPDGGIRDYFRPDLGVERVEDLPAELRGPLREMDCVDCHNRPTHIYLSPTRALEEAMTRGDVPVDLPYVRREAMAVLLEEHATKAAALEAIRAHLAGFYEREYPDLAVERAVDVAHAVSGVQAVYANNVFPSMNIGWNTYPSHIGHEESPGCFRCHDEELTAADGHRISQDCSTCHVMLALEEENPEILQSLLPED